MEWEGSSAVQVDGAELQRSSLPPSLRACCGRASSLSSYRALAPSLHLFAAFPRALRLAAVRRSARSNEGTQRFLPVLAASTASPGPLSASLLSVVRSGPRRVRGESGASEAATRGSSPRSLARSLARSLSFLHLTRLDFKSLSSVREVSLHGHGRELSTVADLGAYAPPVRAQLSHLAHLAHVPPRHSHQQQWPAANRPRAARATATRRSRRARVRPRSLAPPPRRPSVPPR